MDLKQILHAVKNGTLNTEEAERLLQSTMTDKKEDAESFDFAQLDLHREARTGFPEVVYGEGKSAEQIIAILARMMEQSTRVMATRVDADKAQLILDKLPAFTYHPKASALVWYEEDAGLQKDGYIAIVCAGTSDIPVAEEAAVTVQCMGSRVERIYDVGVAGIHRLFQHLPQIRAAQVIIVIAGMEGALASVIAGLVDKPVVAVPTSVGYGANLHGVTALLSMMNACAPGIATVNIDNGFGAGYYAALIHKNKEGC